MYMDKQIDGRGYNTFFCYSKWASVGGLSDLRDEDIHLILDPCQS